MEDLGTFGTARPPVELTFGWFGAVIRVNPRASDLSHSEFMAAAEGIEMPDVDDIDEDNPTPEQLQRMAAAVNVMASVTKALQRFMREQIHPDDWEEFVRLAKENGQQNADLLAVSKTLAERIAEHIAGFPTGPSSGSPPMPLSTSKKFSGGSSSAGRKQRRADSVQADRRRRVRRAAVELLPHRPDLRLALHRQQQAQEAAESGEVA